MRDAEAQFFKHDPPSWDKRLLAKPYSAYCREQRAANYHYCDAAS